jgi:hypothetical protein
MALGLVKNLLNVSASINIFLINAISNDDITLINKIVYRLLKAINKQKKKGN